MGAFILTIVVLFALAVIVVSAARRRKAPGAAFDPADVGQPDAPSGTPGAQRPPESGRGRRVDAS